jgi:hypothetical protein
MLSPVSGATDGSLKPTATPGRDRFFLKEAPGLRLGGSLAERLVGPEANDRQAQGIHCQFIVPHVFAEYIGHAGCPSVAFDFRVV